jgi:hypothetical protein
MAKLVDALCSGRSVRKDVLVRIQFWAHKKALQQCKAFFNLTCGITLCKSACLPHFNNITKINKNALAKIIIRKNYFHVLSITISVIGFEKFISIVAFTQQDKI